MGPECGYVAQLTKLRLVLEASKYTIEHLSGLGTANDEADDNPFSRAGADNVNYKSGRTDDDIMELLEATSYTIGLPLKWFKLKATAK